MSALHLDIVREACIASVGEPGCATNLPLPAQVRLNGCLFTSERPLNAGEAESINRTLDALRASTERP